LIKDFVGTPAFASPEACGGKEYKGAVGDIWSIGVTLYCLIYGRLPFSGNSFMETFENIKNEEVNLTLRSDLSKELLDLIPRILEKDPKKRITLEGIRKHAWLKSDKKTSIIQQSKMKKLSQRLSFNPFGSSKNIFKMNDTDYRKKNRTSNRSSFKSNNRKSWSFMPDFTLGPSHVSHAPSSGSLGDITNGEKKSTNKRWSIFSFKFNSAPKENEMLENTTENDKEFKKFLEELLHKMGDEEGTSEKSENEKSNGNTAPEEKKKQRWSLFSEGRSNSVEEQLHLGEVLPSSPDPTLQNTSNHPKKSGILSKLKHIKKEE
jgi:serine/threonine protein kinase